MEIKLFNRIMDFFIDTFKDCKIKKKKKRRKSKDVSD